MQKAKFEALTFVWMRNGEPYMFTQTGRDAWALSRLIMAEKGGVTPLSEPTGPRWSAYVHKLRRFGIEIETITETHGGAFPGTHARYVLRSDVQLLKRGAGNAE